MSKVVPFKRDTVTIRLTHRQLTDIRVAVLHRLTTISKSLEQHPDDVHTELLQHSYIRLKSMMSEGGVLLNAMRESIRHRDIV